MKKSAPLQNNIQAILTERDMSVRELAKKLNLSPAHMARMVNGQSPLTMKYIFKIAEALNVTPVDVV
ncbi:helix-turn-helix domain-containing protein, partial [Klebsiella pneumoniae]|uniref:helix-turn-helix domain-containing protein n=1 Tax=Klebsiella pneumoniae TaxID=573 RepID=UPI003EE3370C